MLYKLKVKNFAIIEDIEIEFLDKMTVLTGRTGAGKSLLIDSIGLLLGDRADSTYIRRDEDKAIITGEFDFNNKNIEKILDSQGINFENNKLIIYREINKNGKNVIKINDHPVNLLLLKNISRYLADIHSQFDTEKLIDPLNYLSILDKLGDVSKELTDYETALFNYQEALKKYKEVIKRNSDLEEKLDLYKFQLTELNSFNLKENEIDELEEKINKLKNYDKIYQSLKESVEIFDSNMLDEYYEIINNIKRINSFDDNYQKTLEKIENNYYELLETKDFLKKEFNNLDFDPELLETYQSRLYDLKSLSKKYNKTIPELIKYLEEIKFKVDLKENYEDLLKSRYSEVEKRHEGLLKFGIILSNKRKEISTNFSNSIKKELESLMLPDVIFKVDFIESDYSDVLNSSNFNEDGIDNIDFLIQINKGEGLKPLSKTASGGELSRIMLIIKTLIAKNENISLMVFDEIDSGVSGEVATKIALKMKEIAKYSQVLSITHLAQVAAISDHQIHVFKYEKENRTIFDFKYLNKEDRIIEIAKMISGDNYNKYALEIAKDMMNAA